MEISFINVDLPNKWGILYILFSSSEGDKKLLKLLDLHSLQFKIIHKPDWYVLGWHVLVTLPLPHFFFLLLLSKVCLTNLFPLNQEKFTLVTKLLIHSINFLLHHFPISLSDFFAKPCGFTICSGQPESSKRLFCLIKIL